MYKININESLLEFLWIWILSEYFSLVPCNVIFWSIFLNYIFPSNTMPYATLKKNHVGHSFHFHRPTARFRLGVVHFVREWTFSCKYRKVQSQFGAKKFRKHDRKKFMHFEPFLSNLFPFQFFNSIMLKTIS